MAVFEIIVNGERRFLGDAVTAITLATEWIDRHELDRVLVHVGVGFAEDRQVQYLGTDLKVGDEISVRIVDDAQLDEYSTFPRGCSFCGSDQFDVGGLRGSRTFAICDGCIAAFDAVVSQGAALPLGASIRDRGPLRCGFCLKGSSDVVGLIVRNDAAICPACLHDCREVTSPPDD